MKKALLIISLFIFTFVIISCNEDLTLETDINSTSHIEVSTEMVTEEISKELTSHTEISTELETEVETEIETEEPTSQPDISIVINTEFVLFEMAKNHSIAISSSNEVYGWGDNEWGQLGESTNSSSSGIINLTRYFELWPSEDFIDIALGDFHSSILTSAGRVFSWGDNSHGQIGDTTYSARYIPADVTQYFNLNEDERIIEIESGAGHMMALTTDNRVFAWGYNANGQLGTGSTMTYNQAFDITRSLGLTINEEVIKISTGYEHSAVLTSKGRFISWGYNELGQLGIGTTDNLLLPEDHTQFFSLNDDEMLTDIELGYYHSAVLTSDNRVFVWGLNASGQVGNQSRENILLPTDITDNFNLVENDYIINLSFGGWTSSAISHSGQVFVWGTNGQGRLAISIPEDVLAPKNIMAQFDLYQNESISEIILGGWSSSVLTTYGRILTWGRNNTFQLGYHSSQTWNDVPREVIIE